MAREKKRYVVVMDMYVYAENDYMARKAAHKIADNLKNLRDNQARVTDIVEQPFASFTNRKLKNVSKPSNGEEMPF